MVAEPFRNHIEQVPQRGTKRATILEGDWQHFLKICEKRLHRPAKTSPMIEFERTLGERSSHFMSCSRLTRFGKQQKRIEMVFEEGFKLGKTTFSASDQSI